MSDDEEVVTETYWSGHTPEQWAEGERLREALHQVLARSEGMPVDQWKAWFYFKSTHLIEVIIMLVAVVGWEIIEGMVR